MTKRQRKRQLKKLGVPIFSRFDIYELFIFQARFIVAGLREFRKHNVSVPMGGMDEMDINPESRDSSINDRAMKKWHDIIDKMIYSFNQIANEYSGSPNSLWLHQRLNELEKQGIPFFGKRHKNEDGTYSIGKSNVGKYPESVQKAQKVYSDKISEGLQMYAKYFQDLWI